MTIYHIVDELMHLYYYERVNFEKIDQVELISKVLGYEIQLKKRIISPLRHEKRPSFCFIYKDNTLIFNDFGSGIKGDWKFFLMNLWNCEYKEMLKRVIEGNYVYLNTERIERYNKNQSRSIAFTFTKRAYTRLDKAYWASYGITDYDKLENYYNVFSVQSIDCNGNLYSYINKDTVLFAYNELTGIKFYCPFETLGWKWRSSTKHSDVFNLNNILPSKTIIITSSKKDIIVCETISDTIQAISPMSENVYLSEEIMQVLLLNFKVIFIAMDNDAAGKKATQHYTDKYENVIPLEFPIAYKDLAEFRLQTSWSIFSKHLQKSIQNSFDLFTSKIIN